MNRIYAVCLGAIACLAALTAKALADDPAPSAGYVPACQLRAANFSLVVRSDFSDLGPLNCTHDLISAQGATLSWANNLLTRQNSAALDGLVALDYTYIGAPGSDLVGFSVAPYLQGNDTYQFQPTKSQAINGDTVTAGGFAEIAFVNPFLKAAANPLTVGFDDFRIREGAAFASTGTRSDSFVFEWIPSYQLGRYRNIGLPNEIGASALYYTISPELMVQYDHLDGGPNKNLIFSTNNQALRVGPEVVLQFNIEKDALPTSVPKLLREFLGNTSALITNHESWDTYTGKEYSWTAISVSYTFPGYNNGPSHLGVSTSYGFGNSEATGNVTRQAKLGLAVKF